MKINVAIGDITKQPDAQAMVNSANAGLLAPFRPARRVNKEVPDFRRALAEGAKLVQTNAGRTPSPRLR